MEERRGRKPTAVGKVLMGRGAPACEGHLERWAGLATDLAGRCRVTGHLQWMWLLVRRAGGRGQEQGDGVHSGLLKAVRAPGRVLYVVPARRRDLPRREARSGLRKYRAFRARTLHLGFAGSESASDK